MNRLEALPYNCYVAPHVYLACGPEKARFPHCNGFLLLANAQRIVEEDGRYRVT